MHNIALLNKVMDHIEADPAHHDQSVWVGYSTTDCGTTACFAGWTVLLEHEVIAQQYGFIAQQYNNEQLPEEARELLGLSVDEANWMFDCNRTREDLRNVVDTWTEQAMADIDVDDVVASLVEAEAVSV